MLIDDLQLLTKSGSEDVTYLVYILLKDSNMEELLKLIDKVQDDKLKEVLIRVREQKYNKVAQQDNVARFSLEKFIGTT